MKNLITQSKVQKIVEKHLLEKMTELKEHLLAGNLLDYEKNLRIQLDKSYNDISELLLNQSSTELLNGLEKQARGAGLKRLRKRPISIQLATGKVIKVEGLYANDIPINYKESRHLLANHWTIISNSSLGYIDKVCMSSVLCPSYSIANQLLTRFGTIQSISRIRKLTNDIGLYCKDLEVKLNLKPQENLTNKRVVIGVDGGRTRTRQNKKELNKKGNLKYETEWKEPKLFVIHVIDKNGQLDIRQLPIYGCRFDQDDMLDLLKQYLKSLQINDCKEVQILADGAPWIWNNIKPILLELEVAENKITETLDYYHAIGYVNKLVSSLPSRIKEEKRKELLKKFSLWLWTGQSDKIALECREMYKRPSKLVKRWIKYLDKHKNKTQYADYQSNKLMCGSGIIESGIRRMINLKFKSPSVFWDKDNVENLFFSALPSFLIVGQFLWII